MVEQLPFKQLVRGSNPRRPTIKKKPAIPLKYSDCGLFRGIFREGESCNYLPKNACFCPLNCNFIATAKNRLNMRVRRRKRHFSKIVFFGRIFGCCGNAFFGRFRRISGGCGVRCGKASAGRFSADFGRFAAVLQPDSPFVYAG